MTNEEARTYFIDSNERIISVAKDENRYNYETQQIEDVFMRRDFEAKELAIKAFEQQPITWIVGKDNCQVAVRNMPIDKMQKICAIIGEEEQQLCEDMRDATEEERKSTKDYIDSISKPTGVQFDDIYEELDFVQPHKKISVNLQPCEDSIRELIREFDDKHPALFADYMQEFNNHPISEIIEYMWDMHDLIEDIRYRLPNESGAESEEEEW